MIFLATFIVLTIAGCGLGKCPDRWVNHGDFCYFFSTDAKNWTSARNSCISKGGYLAEPKTKAESDYLEAVSRIRRTGFWLGGTDLAVEGQWLWVHSNETFNNTYTHWMPGEPNQLGNEDCLHIYGGIYEWNDTLCHLDQVYICEHKYEDNT